jgi:hypothetical protein
VASLVTQEDEPRKGSPTKEEEEPEGYFTTAALSHYLNSFPNNTKLLLRMRRPKGEAHRGMSPLTCQVQLGQIDPNRSKEDILIDYGSGLSLMSKKIYESLDNPPKLTKGRTLEVGTTSGTFKMDRMVSIPVFFFNSKGSIQIDVEFWINPIESGINLILGLDWIAQYQIEAQLNDMEAHILIQ